MVQYHPVSSIGKCHSSILKLLVNERSLVRNEKSLTIRADDTLVTQVKSSPSAQVISKTHPHHRHNHRSHSTLTLFVGK